MRPRGSRAVSPDSSGVGDVEHDGCWQGPNITDRAAARVIVAVGLCAWIILARPADGQTCAEPHYRWRAKIDTTLATHAATPVDIPRMLTSWAPPGATSLGACAPRSGREDSVFVLTGWVRRLELHEADGDWHIELTEMASTPVTACILVEIPAERYGAEYRTARTALAALVDTTRLSARGVVASPVRIRVTGAAFFDGYHELPWFGGTPRPALHGRCNASLRALWELHPLYKVEASGPR